MRPGLRRFCCALSAAMLLVASGCSEAPKLPSLTPYKIDIQQGNFVTQEMVAKLKPGMTASQVRFILGTPLVVDAFHKDRWDYVYRYSKGGTLQETRRIVVVFKDDKLARIEGDVVPAQPGSATAGGVTITKPAPDGAKENAHGPGAVDKPVRDGALPSGGAAPKDNAAAGAKAPGSAAETAEKKGEEKPAEERGFFGRMLERMGF